MYSPQDNEIDRSNRTIIWLLHMSSPRSASEVWMGPNAAAPSLMDRTCIDLPYIQALQFGQVVLP